MTPRRRTCWLVFAAAVVAGSLSDRRPAHVPRQHDGFSILAADFHVHSFFGDGALPPWELRREAERRGLDVIAITNHNQMAAAPLAAWLSKRFPGPLILPAEEVTTPRFHLTAVGVRHPVDWRQPLAATIEAIHAAGGVAIAAHPRDPSPAAFDDQALTRLDGLEISQSAGDADTAVPQQMGAVYARSSVLNPRGALIGASDFHFLAPLGSFRTYLLARDRTEDAVLEAVRDGRTVGCNPQGVAHGRQEMVEILGGDCARWAARTPPAWWSPARLAVAGAWGALLTIVLVAGTAREHD